VARAGLKHLREDPDRDYYSLGKGQVVAYKEPVLDPSDLAFDMIDYVTEKRRATRVFNGNAAVAMAGGAVLYLLNYGRPRSCRYWPAFRAVSPRRHCCGPKPRHKP